jgi:hypothetical protein
MTAMVVGRSGAEEGQGAVGSAICAAGKPASEMACGVDQGMSILEGSNVQNLWAMDFGGVVGGGKLVVILAGAVCYIWVFFWYISMVS